MTNTLPYPFIEHLRALTDKQNRGALAALRRGLGQSPGSAATMYPHVVPWLPANISVWEEEIHYLVASLFAWNPASTDAGNLGDHLRHLAGKRGESKPIERRFTILLNAHRDDLPDQLRQIIGLLKSGDVPVNWNQLFKDLQAWEHPQRYVQRQWARGYWGRTSSDDGTRNGNGKGE